MRLAVPDLISNSYFPAIAAAELGYFAEEGLDVTLDLVFPVTDAANRLAAGDIDLLAGAAHAPLHADGRWDDVQLVAALARNMYWFLVVGADSPIRDTGPQALAGLTDHGPVRIGAAPGPDLGLRQMLVDSGIDIDRSGIDIAPVPGTDSDSVSFGVTAAEALAAGRIDAFWANGMGAEVAVQRGVGRVIYDARREGGHPATFTFPALMAARRTIETQPDAVAAAVRGVVRVQRALRSDPTLATAVGSALFPAAEADLIAGIIERDLPYYDPHIDADMVAGVNRFAVSSGLAAGPPDDLGDAVATRFAPQWD